MPAEAATSGPISAAFYINGLLYRIDRGTKPDVYSDIYCIPAITNDDIAAIALGLRGIEWLVRLKPGIQVYWVQFVQVTDRHARRNIEAAT